MILYAIFFVAPYFAARLGGTNIMLSQDGVLYQECDVTSHIRSDQDFNDVEFIYVTCNPRRLARYVKLQRIPGRSYQSQNLNVCEVQVYGYQYEGQYLLLEVLQT